jgi:hypothetical protein
MLQITFSAAYFRTEMLGIACDFQKSFRAGAKQEIVTRWADGTGATDAFHADAERTAYLCHSVR